MPITTAGIAVYRYGKLYRLLGRLVYISYFTGVANDRGIEDGMKTVISCIL